MANEIERKFLVTSDAWRTGARSERFRQGYLSALPGRTVRVRVAGAKAYVTIKGERRGISRLEFEYEIPVADAEHILEALCEKPLIEKTRHFIEHAGRVWEVDEFLGQNAGLVVAEIELDDAAQEIVLPDWVGQEVSEDSRYSNSNLIKHPFNTWRTEFVTLTEQDRVWVGQFVTQHWGADVMVTKGKAFRISEMLGFAAMQNNALVGLLSYRLDQDQCEITSLDSLNEGQGIGTALIEQVNQAARMQGCKRLWLITTNDNTHAIRFYQRRGFVLVAVHRHAVDAARNIKPEIPLIGRDGIPIRDEIEMEMML